MSQTLSYPETRTDPPLRLDERDTLLAFLDCYRETVVIKLDGLDRDAVTRRLLPSHTTLLGVVKHLTRVEQFWFLDVFSAEPSDPAGRYADDRDWLIESDETPEALVDTYRSVYARSNDIARAASSLEAAAPGPKRPGTTLRWILVHMIDETARHAGHSDILRELIDGRTGE